MKLQYFPFLIISFSLLIVSSCASRMKAQQEDCLIIQEATSQSHTPGVYSNMRGNTEYRVVLSKPCMDEVEITQILVKDVLLNVKSIRVGGKFITEDFKLKGAYDSLIVFANQYEYNEEGPKVHPEELYEASGKDLGKKLALRYQFMGQVRDTDPAEIKVLEPMLHN